MDTLERVLERTIFLTVAGSHLYGTNVAGSDYDFKGICIPTEDYFFGYLKSFEQLERQVAKGHPHDLTITALAKFCRLAADCNPNVIELLFAPEDAIVHVDRFGRMLLENRRLFLSRKARFTFSGYAHSQLKRIKTHRKWLLEPPKAKPTRADFGLAETTKVSKSELGAFEAMQKDGLDAELPKDILTLFLRERQYQAALTHWNQYENWTKTRNPLRHAMEAESGYDRKHAMHLLRLMRMCMEILRDGEVNVRRSDRDELVAIRNGARTYDEVIEEAESLEAECAKLYETSPLPKEPDRLRIERVVVGITKEYLDV